jgi:hypothetical protein
VSKCWWVTPMAQPGLLSPIEPFGVLILRVKPFFSPMTPSCSLAVVALCWLLACRSFAGETATAVATVTAGYVTAISVTSGGSGYVTEPTVTITGGGGSGAIATAFTENGRVVEVVVLSSGSGYTSVPVVQIFSQPIERASMTMRRLAAVLLDGPLLDTQIVEWSPGPNGPWTAWTNSGSNPSQTEWIDFEGNGQAFRIRSVGKARAAVGVAAVRGGYVSSVVIADKGAGYARAPIVTLTGGGGNGASAVAILEGDKVASVVLLNAGSGYSTAPEVTITPPLDTVPLRHRWVSALKVADPDGKGINLYVGRSIVGPWTQWTNGVVGGRESLVVDLSPAEISRYYRARLVSLPSGSIGFVWIPSGTFVMGSPESEPDRNDDEVQHTVTLTKGFWLCDHEVTQAEYEAVMGNNPSYFKGADRPVEQVRWTDAVFYCQKLTERERAAGRITTQQAYRLPTEAEWEYAARAGTIGSRYGSLDAVAWWVRNSSGPGYGGQTHLVKDKQSNRWNLYDMFGNVFEWCSDWYGAYPVGNVKDPTGPDSNTYRVSRGGSWNSDSGHARSALRQWDSPGTFSYTIGFRVALSEVR